MSDSHDSGVQQRDGRFHGVRQAITAAQNGEEWSVPGEQPERVFRFDHRLDSFLFDLDPVGRGPKSIARMQKQVIKPGNEQWVDWQMLSESNGGLMANGYPALPVDPNDPAAVLELVRWMITNGWVEPPIPGSPAEWKRRQR